MPKNLAKNQVEDEEVGESESLDFTRPTYIFKPNEQHEWRQQGPYVICKSCELQHAVFIGMDKMLVGLNDKGQPILKKR